MTTEAERITEAMEHLGVNAPGVAQALGYASKSTVYSILKSKRSCPLSFYEKFCTQYPQISLAYLKSGSGELILTTAGMISQGNLLGKDSKQDFESNVLIALTNLESTLVKIQERLYHINKLVNSINQPKNGTRNNQQPTERVRGKRKRKQTA